MRDFYFDTEELPGPVYAREEDLLEGLEDISRIKMSTGTDTGVQSEV